jgi:hypothetical protein
MLLRAPETVSAFILLATSVRHQVVLANSASVLQQIFSDEKCSAGGQKLNATRNLSEKYCESGSQVVW